MDHPGYVSSGERIRDGDGDLECVPQLHADSGNALAQRVPADELHDEQVALVYRQDIVNDDDVRMIQGGDGTGFGEQAAAGLRVSDGPVDDLERHIALQSVVPGAPDLTHAA